ncbi:uncharacterized protein B0I36DRAFT_351497 [Microdochium trichocladiopsis]|uniref:Uncharacterized protein n=1 Tax=Microdochium trichocladiopsis TaxID=1682393 RepID=A0A9P9BS84_9PEZI|nr:uncharacterized protein B0I36DRAFT_351497 [Microdochium trichocladiopsis]KAH7028060.1 hypothetical protein B0I36DRAFT_351497 [Microdochium trichocladiopsis]
MTGDHESDDHGLASASKAVVVQTMAVDTVEVAVAAAVDLSHRCHRELALYRQVLCVQWDCKIMRPFARDRGRLGARPSSDECDWWPPLGMKQRTSPQSLDGSVGGLLIPAGFPQGLVGLKPVAVNPTGDVHTMHQAYVTAAESFMRTRVNELGAVPWRDRGPMKDLDSMVPTPVRDGRRAT